MTELSIDWLGLTVCGTIVTGTEGDADVPGGTNEVFELQDLWVESPEGDDITHFLTSDALKTAEHRLLGGLI